MIYISCHIHLELGEEVAAEAGSLNCGPCRLRTYSILLQIQELYEWISDPSYLAGTREPASSYTKSRPPVSLHAVSLLDKRTKYRRKGDPVSADRVLGAWCKAVADIHKDGTGAYGPEFNVKVWYLQIRLDWIMNQPAGARFARHMACVLHSLKQEVGNLTEGELDNDDSSE